MHSFILNILNKRQKPIDVILVGLGFMGFGFLSNIQGVSGVRVPLLVTRRPKEAHKKLVQHKFKAKIENDYTNILKNIKNGVISVTDNISLIKEVEADVVFEVTGTVGYGADVALNALNSKKHLVTMNPELQVTLGSELKKIADERGVLISDVVGDQPGSISNLIAKANLMGFEILVAGNMKRFMNKYATQKEMKPWADDKGLAVRQTTSFTDGTKQSIEMNLVANFFGMDITEEGMVGPKVESVQEALEKFDFKKIGKRPVVDFVLGLKLFPGVFLITEHKDPNQQKYLRYLGLGDGPRYLLFEPYHLCHLEATETIAKLVLFNEVTINNGKGDRVMTAAYAKRSLKRGEVLDGIGGDTVYGNIVRLDKQKQFLPVGLSEGVVLKKGIKKDGVIKISDVELPDNTATRLLGLVKRGNKYAKEVDSGTIAVK